MIGQRRNIDQRPHRRRPAMHAFVSQIELAPAQLFVPQAAVVQRR